MLNFYLLRRHPNNSLCRDGFAQQSGQIHIMYAQMKQVETISIDGWVSEDSQHPRCSSCAAAQWPNAFHEISVHTSSFVTLWILILTKKLMQPYMKTTQFDESHVGVCPCPPRLLLQITPKPRHRVSQPCTVPRGETHPANGHLITPGKEHLRLPRLAFEAVPDGLTSLPSSFGLLWTLWDFDPCAPVGKCVREWLASLLISFDTCSITLWSLV